MQRTQTASFRDSPPHEFRSTFVGKMRIDHPAIVGLREKVRAAHEEFEAAMACHEAWKPAAYDKKLHERLGTSLATNTFLVVRLALRREMLLALMRLWDRQSDAVGMRSIANTLGDKRVIEALAADCEACWTKLGTVGLEDFPERDRSVVSDAVRRSDAEHARKEGDALRRAAAEAVEIIRRYEKDTAYVTMFKKLKTLRDERLAHRQVTLTPVEADDKDVECSIRTWPG